jgi:hypothetical protein
MPTLSHSDPKIIELCNPEPDPIKSPQIVDLESAQPLQNANLAPPTPEQIEDTALDLGFLANLALKTVYSDVSCTTGRIAQKLKLPLTIVESLLQHLYRDKFIEIRGMEGFQNHRYAMLDRGWERIRRLLEISGYIGPAPVSLNSYSEMVQRQERAKDPIGPESVRNALSGLVLPESTVQTLGLVANSRRSLFITGPSGNGKTSMARAIHSALGGEIWIPYAIEVDGQVIKVFDPHNHEPVHPQPPIRHDQRWVKIKRPLVIVGGEVTIETMDLIYSQTVRYYEAPFQMKSNGGILVIDDFGRQRVDPHDLLNRWIIPLEGHVDYLTLHTGKKIQVPFEQLLIFATNLDPRDLVDDAFLRRMGYRLPVHTPTREDYTLIFQRYLEAKGLPYDAGLIESVLTRYKREKRTLRGCEPRDLIERCLDICRYESRPREITPALLDLAWSNYFGSKAR